MKKIFLLIASVLLVSSMAWAADEVTEIKASKLPPITQSTIKSYFPGTEITSAYKAKSKVKNSFNVTLSDGTELEFDKDGQWTRVYCGGNPVPTTMVNLRIKDYMQKNCPDATVVLMEKAGKEYKITLADGKVLTFDHQFRFVQ